MDDYSESCSLKRISSTEWECINTNSPCHNWTPNATKTPTSTLTQFPTKTTIKIPTKSPPKSPTKATTKVPSNAPTFDLTQHPTHNPSINPSFDIVSDIPSPNGDNNPTEVVSITNPIGIILTVCIGIVVLVILISIGLIWHIKREATKHVLKEMEKVDDDMNKDIVYDEGDKEQKEGDDKDDGILDEKEGKQVRTQQGLCVTLPADEPFICDILVERDKQHKSMMESWLMSIFEVPMYYDIFVSNGYESLDFIKEIQDEMELKDIGIEDKEHQTRIMNAIHDLKEEGDTTNIKEEE